MKYRLEIDIDLPRDKVIALFDNQDNLKHWQPELISFTHQSGTRGQPGAKSRLLYNMGGREMEMIETILIRDLPEQFSGTYEAKNMWNQIDNRFIAVSDNRTKWLFESEFRGSGIMNFMIWLLPGLFKKQSLKYLKQFKAWAEAA